MCHSENDCRKSRKLELYTPIEAAAFLKSAIEISQGDSAAPEQLKWATSTFGSPSKR
jgi:hypothetical protein